jgi:SNF2 family DNA or RNA helicase
MTALELRDYQKVGVHFLHNRKNAGLFLDMGLGKTAISLSALTPDHLPALVVAPKRVAETVWDAERDLWRPDLSIAVAAVTDTTRGAAKGVDQRGAALRAGADITVIGRDNFQEVLKVKGRPYRTLIIDELSGFKSSASVRYRVAQQLAYASHTRIDHVWGLTGTPAPNGLLDLWPQMYLLDEGERLHTTLGEYRARYFVPGKRLPNGTVAEWHLVNGMDQVIYDKIEDICLSMSTEGRVTLPPITYNDVEVPLPPKAMQVYADLKDELVADLTMLGGEIHTAQNAAMLSNRLSQVAAGFVYSDDRVDGGGVTSIVHRAKAESVVEIVEGTGSPVMVLYGYEEEERLIREALAKAKIPVHKPTSANLKAWNRGEIRVLLTHPASVGHGLNLQHGGFTQIWSTMTWELELWEQGIKRLWRSGQQHPVVIHRLLAVSPAGNHLIDHVKRARLERKARVQDALLEHLESPL